MIQVIADLQLHSKYSRAVSSQMLLPNISAWARKKGIGLIATGDWNHPLWIKDIQSQLDELGNGLLKLKHSQMGDPLFLLATEVSCIYSQQGKGRRVHILVWVPSIVSALKINRELIRRGCNLSSDGRPIIGLSAIQLADVVFSIDPSALIIPAHAWTPWFGMYGSKSGFDSLNEAFGQFSNQIYAVETGLSSNPSMNWRIEELDMRTIVSFSDAHSLPKIGREVTVFDLEELSYFHIRKALMARSNQNRKKTFVGSQIAFTIEFYPEEGKYHWSGHRSCSIRLNPKETQELGIVCPVCGKVLTEGVEQRIGQLAHRTEASLQLESSHLPLSIAGISIRMPMIRSSSLSDRPPFVMLVPLVEIIAESIGSPVTSPKVLRLYDRLVTQFNGEFYILLCASIEELTSFAGATIATGIEKVRTGNISIDPGYDGIFGTVRVWKNGEEKPPMEATVGQLQII